MTFFLPSTSSACAGARRASSSKSELPGRLAVTLDDVKPHGQFCPVAQALELVGDRWTLLVIRELLSGSRRFTDILSGVNRIPRSVLAQRLQHLEDTSLVRRVGGKSAAEYELTSAGKALEEIVLGLGLWSRRWAHRSLREDELDATLLMWDMQRRIDGAQTPRDLVVIRFDFTDRYRGYQHYWLKIDGSAAEVCFKHPGIEESLVVRTACRTLTEIWMGHRDFRAAIRSRDVVIEGPPKLARALPTWFRLNVFIELERARRPPAPAPAPARPRRASPVS
jgi:DNA-binding HxlR family transcriptional regulator